MRGFVLANGLALFATAAQAEVVDLQPSGFEVKHTVQIAASPQQVYVALIQPGRWWSSDHTWSGSAANMRFEPAAGGCWCEALPKTQGEVEHMRIIYIDPAGTIRLDGSLGPMQPSGATGHLTWAYAAKADGTEVTWTYDVGGYFPGGFKALAPGVDGVIGDQLGRLKKFIETGRSN